MIDRSNVTDPLLLTLLGIADTVRREDVDVDLEDPALQALVDRAVAPAAGILTPEGMEQARKVATLTLVTDPGIDALLRTGPPGSPGGAAAGWWSAGGAAAHRRRERYEAQAGQGGPRRAREASPPRRHEMIPPVRGGLRLVRGATEGPMPDLTPEELTALVKWAMRIALALSRLVGMAHAADDFIGEALKALAEVLRRYDGGKGASFKTFARHRIVGEVVDAVKREKERLLYEIPTEDADELPYGADEDPDALFRTTGVESFILCSAAGALHQDPEACFLRHEVHAELHRAVQQLPVAAQQLVEMRYWKGLPWGDIVRRLGLPVRTLKDHDLALRAALRAALLDRDEVFPWPYETA